MNCSSCWTGDAMTLAENIAVAFILGRQKRLLRDAAMAYYDAQLADQDTADTYSPDDPDSEDPKQGTSI